MECFQIDPDMFNSPWKKVFRRLPSGRTPAYREAIDISCKTAYRSLPSVWYSIRFFISISSIRIPPDSIQSREELSSPTRAPGIRQLADTFYLDARVHQKKPQHHTVAKNGNKKSLTVKVLFTIRQLQPEYEMQRDPGSFFG